MDTVTKMLLLIICLFFTVQCKHLPLNEERDEAVGLKKSKQIMGCYFGGKLYELEEEWHPNLGAPFGLMTCIKCKCLLVQKKRRVIGRVACKNFVDQCPTPKCADPILQSGQCCKTCPGSSPLELNVFGLSEYNNDLAKDTGYQEFMAVLTGRFKQPPVATEGVGRAYLTLSRRDLHFSIHFEKLEESPVSVQFLDKFSSIAFERTIDKILNKNICGVWSDIPLVYLKSLKNNELIITVVTSKQPEGALGGRIFKPKIINREVFGSLLFPSTMQSVRNLGYGGAAVVDVEAGGDALNVAVWFDAAVNFSSGYSRHVFVSLEKDDGRRRQSQSVRAELVVKDGYYTAETIINISTYEQRWLASGKLLIVLSAEYMVPAEFIGNIQPKQSCDIYIAVLNEESGSSGSAACASLELTNNSTLKYIIKTSGLNDSNVMGFTIDKENRRHRRRLVISNSGPFRFDNSIARGVFEDVINIRDMESFYKEKLFFGLIQKGPSPQLRGSIRRVLYSDSVASSREPFLLSGFTVPKRKISTAGAAALWMSSVDHSNQCSLRFTSIVVGLTVYKMDDLKIFLCHSATDTCSVELRNFAAVAAEPAKILLSGESDEIYGPVWAALNSNQIYVKFLTPLHPDGELAANLTIKNECWKRQVQQDMLVAEDSHTVTAHRLECDFESVLRKDGESFHSVRQNCTTCNCQRGAVKCERVLCPVVNCSTSLVISKGDCCPSCPATRAASDNQSCYWMGDQRHHDVGVSWHPYIAPFGFTKCALCICQMSGEVTCTKTSCPTLSCPTRLRYRENPLDCCAKCRESDPQAKPPKSTLDDESNNQRCFFNNRWYRDDSKFSPKISHVTTLKCIECICKKGRVNCRKTMCAGLDCDDPSRKNGCCPKCSDSRRN